MTVQREFITPKSLRWLSLACLVFACLAATTGCVVPMQHGRSHVSGEVYERTGYDLGPAKSACALIIDQSVDWSDGLSEDEAITIGLWNNPAYQELLADLEIAEADIIQAAQLQNPHVITMLPIGVKQWEFALMVPLDVLWLREIRVSAAELESHRVAQRLVQDGLNVVRDVRFAYIDWQLAVQNLQLAEQGAALRSETARIAEARLAAGDVAEADVSAVRLDALVGIAEAARAARQQDLARQRLRYVLGLQFSDVTLHPAPVTDTPQIDVAVGQLIDDAVVSRPDLRAVEFAVQAASDRADLARRDIWQLIGILPDINSQGLKGFEAGPGLRFNIPLFHQNQGAIRLAEANAERLRRQYVNRRDLAAWEVHQAHLQLMQANTDLDIWQQQVLPEARDAVEKLHEALQESGVSLLLVLETNRQFLSAQLREREAAAQQRRAIAELERSVGHRLAGFSTSHEPLPAPVDVREEMP